MADASSAGSDVFLFAIPLIALLFFGFFRLDQVFTSPKSQDSEKPNPLPARKPKKSMRSDPDGQPWDHD